MTNLESLLTVLTCKGTLILGLVSVLFVIAGRRWPQNCILWQRLSIVALLILPLAVAALPTIGIPVLPAGQVATGELPAPVFSSAPDRTEASQSVPAAISSAANARPSPLPVDRSFEINTAMLFLTAYVVIAAALVIRLGGALRGLARLRHSSPLVTDPSWLSALEHWSQQIKLQRPVELRAAEDVSVPMTFGWRRPVILIPRDCLSGCDVAMRDAIVLHELTHIARGDFFWGTLIRLAGAMYWVHPLSWLVPRQDRTLCERICDALCARHLTRESYARSLVLVAGRRVLRPAAALGIAMAHSSSLGRRLNDLQSDGIASHALTPAQRAITGTVSVAAIGVLVVGALTARAANEPSVPATAESAATSPSHEEQPPPVRPIDLPDTLNGQVLNQEDQPISNTKVTIRLRRDAAQSEPDKETWTTTTDAEGRYRLSTGSPQVRPDDEIRVIIEADGFAYASQGYDAKQLTRGSVPSQRLYTGRTVRGQIVDPQGQPVAAIVRFQASTEDLRMTWDSGPLPVDGGGMFSISIPRQGQAGFAIYPSGYAPRLEKVPEAGGDLGTIRVENGIELAGRVVDRQGRGVPGTVVGIRSEEQIRLYLFVISLATGVKTDANGNFRLPPLRGNYLVWTTDRASDYPRQWMVTGASPPVAVPQRVVLDGKAAPGPIVFREVGTVMIRGNVHWSDGSPAADVPLDAWLGPADWQMPAPLGFTRTDKEGRYALKLPAPIEHAHVAVPSWIDAPDGTQQQAKPVGRGKDAYDITFDELTTDVDDADWVIGPQP